MTVLSNAETLRAALTWARSHGLSPVPLQACVLGPERTGKRPVSDGWLSAEYADTDFALDSNVGIHTGRVMTQGGYLLVVDVDCKEGKSGAEQWETLCDDEGLTIPHTLIVWSGSGNGSKHIYLRTTEMFRDAKLSTCPDIEFKGMGGQVVAAHSPHHTGGVYTPEEADIAWAPIELEMVLKASHGSSSKQRVLTDEQVFESEEVVLSPELLARHIAARPAASISRAFKKMIAGEPLSSPGHRHQEIRLGLLPQILGTLGPNVTMSSLEWAFRGDYPQGFDRDTQERMYDALRTGARKTDPEEALALKQNMGMLALLAAREEAKAVTLRAEIDEALEQGQAPDPADPQIAMSLAGPLNLSVAKGAIKSEPANILKILVAYFSLRMRLNIRTGGFEVRDLPWRDNASWHTLDEKTDAAAFVCYFANHWGISVSMTVLDLVLAVAGGNAFDPVAEYLKASQWDGTERALDLFVRAVGAKDCPHTRAVTRCFLVGAVARALQPGCKLDTQLILSGPQGARKSTFFRTLCADPRWFSDTGRTYGEAEKDFLARLHTLWIWEDSELQTGTRDEAAKKAFLSKTEDTFRPPYARLNVRSDRRFVCAGSTNETDILYDITGSRRYHILEVQGKIDIEYVEAVRDQLWAEALHMYESGVQWWLSDAEQETANQDNEAYRAESPAEDAANMIQTWFEKKREQAMADMGEDLRITRLDPGQYTNTGELWGASYNQIKDALGMRIELLTKAANVLKARGWERKAEMEVNGIRMYTTLCIPQYEVHRETRKDKLLQAKEQKGQKTGPMFQPS